MPACTTAWPQSYFIKGQGHFVYNGQCIFKRHLFFIHPVFKCFATKVHESGWANAYNYFSLPFYCSYISKAANFKIAFMLFCKCVQYIEANIMAGIGVLCTYITKA